MCISDALNGYGLKSLEWLYSPIAQGALAGLLNHDYEGTRELTERLIARITELDHGQKKAVRKRLSASVARNVEAVYEILWVSD